MRTDATPPPPNASSTPPPCSSYPFAFVNFNCFAVANILLLLPLCVFVSSSGVLRWRRRRTASHADVFTYHVVAIETAGVLACGLYLCGVGLGVHWMMSVGLHAFSVTSFGQIVFQILTGGERYLAVVHPIVYLGLRKAGGVRVRNVCLGCVWLFLLSSIGATQLTGYGNEIPILCVLVATTGAVSFFSLAALCALGRPGPGDGGRPRADRFKARACRAIAAILAALTLRVGGHVLAIGVYSSAAWSHRVRCGVLMSGIWFCLPNGLVTPLLFLHRAAVLWRRGKMEAEPRSQ